VLDLGAGIGGTSEAILPWLSEAGRVVAFEPAEAMRGMGQNRVRDARVRWVDALPEGPFDRILCGAALWQMLPLEDTFRRLAGLLCDGGALCFNIPSLYLGEPDEPGGGGDPNLFALPALFGAGLSAEAGDPLPAPGAISALLSECGLHPEPWRCRHPLTQTAYRDWLKIPVLTNHWFGTLDAAERARRIDCAFEQVDGNSWRWEAWSGWTAWRAAASPALIPAAHQPLFESRAASCAASEGYLFFRGLLDPRPMAALRSRLEELHRRGPVPPGAAHDDPRFLELQRAAALLPEWGRYAAIPRFSRRCAGFSGRTFVRVAATFAGWSLPARRAPPLRRTRISSSFAGHRLSGPCGFRWAIVPCGLVRLQCCPDRTGRGCVHTWRTALPMRTLPAGGPPRRCSPEMS
jgi:hypothetical protein